MARIWITCGALVALSACAPDTVSPGWWVEDPKVGHPAGAAWHTEDARCLFAGEAELEWAGQYHACEWEQTDVGMFCVTGVDAEGERRGFAIEPFYAAQGFTGGARVELPGGERLAVQPGCWWEQ